MHRAAAVCCLAAGTGVLAGPGWTLLTLGALLWALAPRPRPSRDEQAASVDEWKRRSRVLASWAKATGGRAAQVPRRTTAVSAMAVGAVTVPVGVMLLYGVGAAVLALGVFATALSLLAGWEPSSPGLDGHA